MPAEINDQKALLEAIHEPVTQLTSLMSSLDDDQVNLVPYEDSWTAGQLFDHVTKSIHGVARAMHTPGKPAERDPGEKTAELKKIFLDYSIKMKSPGFIVPGNGPFLKQDVIQNLGSAFDLLAENSAKTGMTEIVENFPGGEVTKLEILHFVLYHTTRHLHQLHEIVNAVKSVPTA